MEMMMRMNETSRGCWRGKEMHTSRWRSNPNWNSKFDFESNSEFRTTSASN
jgi:hypothetical protein